MTKVPTEEDTAFVAGAVDTAVDALIVALKGRDPDLVEHPDVFHFMNERAKTHGFAIHAHQRGVLGTYVQFVRE